MSTKQVIGEDVEMREADQNFNLVKKNKKKKKKMQRKQIEELEVNSIVDAEEKLVNRKRKTEDSGKNIDHLMSETQNTMSETQNTISETQKGTSEIENGTSEIQNKTSETQDGTSKKKKKKKTPSERAMLDYDLELLFSNNGRRPGGSHLTVKDIRGLYMLAIHGETFYIHPNWCQLKSFQLIAKTVVIMVAGVCAEDYHENIDLFKPLLETFPSALPVRSDGSDQIIKSPLDSLLRYNMPKKLQQRKSRERKLEGAHLRSADQYILSSSQLEANEYPVWNEQLASKGFVSTTYRHGNESVVESVAESVAESMTEPDESRLLALDCEMCDVASGRAVTRVSVVDNELNVVYDKYVKPDEEIKDYLTQWSGITPDLLEGVTTRLADVQQDLLSLLHTSTILVGHSLDFDLRALKFHHKRCIDTSVLFEDARGPRFKSALKYLSKTLLNEEIQAGTAGHCSIQDARACMKLIQRKLELGVSFGEVTMDTESIFEAATRVGKRGALLAQPHIAKQHASLACNSYPCVNDEQVISHAPSALSTSDVIFAQLYSFERELKSTDGSLEVARKRELLSELVARIEQLLAATPSESLVIVTMSGGHVTSRIAEMCRDREMRKREDVRLAVRRAREGVAFVKITSGLC